MLAYKLRYRALMSSTKVKGLQNFANKFPFLSPIGPTKSISAKKLLLIYFRQNFELICTHCPISPVWTVIILKFSRLMYWLAGGFLPVGGGPPSNPDMSTK